MNFSYYKGQNLIQDLSFGIPAKKTTAIVGTTGSGKSTLIKLLSRFYDPTSGQITVGGQDLKSLDIQSLRQNISYVGQDVFLFHGTVRDNITYGSFETSDEDMIIAAKKAEAYEFVMTLPQGFDTIVGERGIKLSGGQRQRLSIARALLKDAPILVLDEATSSVDNETEAAIQRSLEKLAHHKTTIILAHRLSTIRHADQILVLENGIIKEQGHHDELVSKDGLYKNLWQIQTGEAA